MKFNTYLLLWILLNVLFISYQVTENYTKTDAIYQYLYDSDVEIETYLTN